MNKGDDLKKMRDFIIGVELHLSMLQLDLAAADRDAEFLQNMDAILRENIQILKMDKIVALASEYKRVVKELADIQENVRYYINLKASISQEIAKYIKIKESSLLQFEAMEAHAKTIVRVVPFDLSKKRKK